MGVRCRPNNFKSSKNIDGYATSTRKCNRATLKLFFVQRKCRAGEPLHHRHDFLHAACGTSQHIEELEAVQGVEHVDRLVECLGGWSSIPFSDPPGDDTQSVPPPFIS